MATFRRKGKGYEVRWYDAAGRRHSKTVTGTLRDAKVKAAAWEGSPGRGEQTQTTFEVVAHQWLAAGGRRHSQLSQEGAERRLRLHTLPALGPIPVADLTPHAIEAFHADLLRKGLSPNSIRVIHSDISGVLNRAVRDGLVARNAARLCSPPSAGHRHEVDMPTVADVEKLLDHMDTSPSFAVAEAALGVRLGLATGGRIGEVVGLRWDDIDFNRGVVAIVRGVIQPVHQAPVVQATKTRSRRAVAVPLPLVDRLASHRLRAQSLGLDVTDGDFVLQGRQRGVPMTPSALRSRVAEQQRQVGVRFRFHALRHLAASIWVEDLDLASASRAIGHSRKSLTADVYTHRLRTDVDRRTAESLSRRIRL